MPCTSHGARKKSCFCPLRSSLTPLPSNNLSRQKKKLFPSRDPSFVFSGLHTFFKKRKNHFPAFRVPDDPQVAPRRRVLQGLLPLPERDPLRAHLRPGVPARQVRRAGRVRVRPGVRRAGLHKV